MIRTEVKYDRQYEMYAVLSKYRKRLMTNIAVLLAEGFIITRVLLSAAKSGLTAALLHRWQFWILIALVLITVAETVMIFILLFSRMRRSGKSVSGFQADWRFSTDGFSVDFRSAVSVQKLEYTWDAVREAAEYKKYFHLIQKNGQHQFLFKQHFTEGTPEELRELLAEKLGKRFRRRHK